MRKRLINPWQCPPDSSQCRLLELENLPPGCSWNDLHQYFVSYDVEYQTVFDTKALVQLVAPHQARDFFEKNNGKLSLCGYQISVYLSPLIQLILTADSPTRTAPSHVICIQVMKLRVCLGIQDIYDECAQFGAVEKIICFEKTGKFALVQMSTVEQASLVLVNLSNSPRHLPAFQFRVQYSKNQDIVIKFNNSKSFDFTQSDAKVQFTRMRESTAGERPFFVIDECEDIGSVFDFWRPVSFDPTFSSVIGVCGFDDKFVTCDNLYNLFSQYGPVKKVKIAYNRRRVAYIMFSNNFYARLATAFLNNCPFEGKHLSVDFPLNPECIQQTDFGDQFCKDYANNDSDFEINDYSTLSFPSKCVSIKKGDVTKLTLPETAELYSINSGKKNIRFQTIDDATRFIYHTNRVKFDNQLFEVSFYPS